MTPADVLPELRLHTLLRSRGGTTAVAHTVGQAAAGAGAGVEVSYELEDAPDGFPGDILVKPEAVGRWAGSQGRALLHLHASDDWASCLRGALDEGLRSIVTLHDCRALTGGCPYPLACTEWQRGCVPDCPRGFEAADEVCGARREVLQQLNPTLVSPSRWLANMAREVLPDLDIRVIPNGIPWPETLPSKVQVRENLGLAPGVKLMLFAAHGGVEAGYKRGGQWLDFYDRIKAQVPETLCFIVGGEKYERRGDLVFWPYVDNATMHGFLRAADVLVYPSQADNHPLSVLEAMSQGLAVAAFGSGGIPEQLATPDIGVCIESCSWLELQDAVVRLLTTPRLARNMGEKAFEYGRKRFCASRMASDYLKLYRRVGA